MEVNFPMDNGYSRRQQIRESARRFLVGGYTTRQTIDILKNLNGDMPGNVIETLTYAAEKSYEKEFK